MKRFLGLLLSLALMTGILAGCAGTPDENAGTSTPSVIETGTPEASDTKETAWPRTFTDARGVEITIEKEPIKIASLWYFYPELLIALGEVPCASTETEYLSSLSYLKDGGEMSSVMELGNKMSPDLEKLLDTEPDLILGTQYHEEIYDSLSKIAPVIILNHDDVYADWRVGLKTVGQILGKEKDADAAIEKVMTEISSGREILSSRKDETIAFIGSNDGKAFYVYGKNTPLYRYAFDEELGLGLTPDDTFNEMGDENTTLEGIASIEAEHIFYIDRSDDSYMSNISQLKSNSVWNSLKAVKNGNVHFLDVSAITGGPLATEYGVKTIVEALSK